MKRKNEVTVFLVTLLFCALFAWTYLYSFQPAPVPSLASPSPLNFAPISDDLAQPQVSSNNLSTKVDSELLNASFLDQEGYIQNGSIRVIVQFNSTSEKMADEVTSLGGDCVKVFDEIFLEVLTLPYSALYKLASLPDLTHVYLDRKAQVLDSSSLPIIEPPSEWANVTATYGSLTGAGITIAVIDTGIDPTHPDFFFPNGTSKIIDASDFSGLGHTWDGYGHGTHCASIAAGTGAASSGTNVGVAPEALLINAKVFDDHGSGSISNIISGIQWAVGQGANILSMSFGVSASLTDGSDVVSQAVDWASDQGVACCAAAGNSGPYVGTVSSPGCAKTAITVGACDSSMSIANFSSRGPTSDYRVKPEVIAPGVNIVAARANQTSLGTVVDQYYTTLSGTSMAAPHVAGAVALIEQAHPNWTPEQIRTALVEAANVSSIKPSDDILAVGGGLVDVANTITVSTFASNSYVSFQVNQAFVQVNQTLPLSFSPAASSGSFTVGKCISNGTFQIIYSNGSVTFCCPANTTNQWSGRLHVAGGSLFKPAITIPVLAFSTYFPPSPSSWYNIKTYNTTSTWPRTMAVAGDLLYVGDSYCSGNILEYHLPDMNLQRSLTLPDTWINSMLISDRYLYAGTNYGFVFKISLETFSIQARLSLPDNIGITKLLFCNSKLFASNYDGYIYVIDPVTMGLLKSSQIDSNIMAGAVGDSCVFFLSSMGNLSKVDQNLQASKLNLGVSGFGLNSLVSANGNLYAVANNNPNVYVNGHGPFPLLLKISYEPSILNCSAFQLAYKTTDSLELVYDDNQLYLLTHALSNATTEYDYFLRINEATLSADGSLNVGASISQTYGIFTDPPFLCAQETLAAWNNYLICSFDSGKICLTRDLSAKTSIPTFINSTVKSTSVGKQSQISTYWHSKTGLSGFIAGSNSTGSWTNQTWQPLNGNLAVANFPLPALGGGVGDSLGWKIWCNDTSNNWACTGIQSFTLDSGVFYTLTILPSEIGTNIYAGQYSIPNQTSVTVSIDETVANGYVFKNWLVDGVPQTNNSTIVVMDKDHRIQVQDALTADVVAWEKFAPVSCHSYVTVCSDISNGLKCQYAQTFAVGNNAHTVTSVKLYLYRLSSNLTGPLTISIMATFDGLPSGPNLAQGDFDPNLITKYTGDWYTIPMTSPSTPLVLQANTQYAVIAKDDNDASLNSPMWGYQYKITQFPVGDLYRLNGASWQLRGDTGSTNPHMPCLFQILGVASLNPTPTSTPTSGGTGGGGSGGSSGGGYVGGSSGTSSGTTSSSDSTATPESTPQENIDWFYNTIPTLQPALVTFDFSSLGLPALVVAAVAIGGVTTGVVMKKRRISERTLRGMTNTEFQAWVLKKLHGTPVAGRELQLGFNGFTGDGRPIMIRQSENVGMNEIDMFATGLARNRNFRGVIVAFNFGTDAIRGKVRARMRYKLDIELITVSELLYRK